MQDDLLNGKLTVEETLYYAAELRLPSTMTTAEKKARIEEVLRQLGLIECRNVIIGDHMTRGISGGQRKRVAVAIELLTKPRLLFLDEPTSGLDSVTALSLCTLLRDIAHSGQCTVVTTIHQPQSKIFYMFDDLILLKAGRIVYYGATGDVTDFFSEAGFPCPNQTNPADHILDVITAQTQEQKESVEQAENKLIEMQKNKNAVVVEIEQDSSVMTNKIVHGHQRSSWWHQFTILLQRCFKEQIRSRSVIITTMIQSILMAILIGTVFLQIGDSQSSIVRRQPVLFFCVINQGIFSALTLINSFPKERTLVLRERAAGTYYVSAYFLAKNMAEMATQVIAPMVFSLIVYFLVGLQLDAGKFFIFMLFMVLGSVAATSMALMISALARTTDMSVTVLPMILELARLYGGFFLSPANLPKYFVWLDALSYVKYTYVGISLNELTGLSLNCDNLASGATCVTSGETTINNLGFDQYSISLCAGVLVVMIVGFRMIAYLGVRYIKW
jgi:ATP-binding cassette subfamily G (WHITE) protein 2